MIRRKKARTRRASLSVASPLLVVLAVRQGLDCKALGVLAGSQFQLLHDLETNIQHVGSVAHPFSQGRNTAIGSLNQVDAEQ